MELLLQNTLCQILDELYNIAVEPSQIILQATKKEFAGDYTLVVFP